MRITLIATLVTYIILSTFYLQSIHEVVDTQKETLDLTETYCGKLHERIVALELDSSK